LAAAAAVTVGVAATEEPVAEGTTHFVACDLLHHIFHKLPFLLLYHIVAPRLFNFLSTISLIGYVRKNRINHPCLY
jgi:hypothetical protein